VSFVPDAARTAYEGRLIGLTVERWGDHEREIVEHPGAVAIVAVDDAGSVTLVRQLREPARMHLFSVEGVERGEACPAADEELELVRWSVTEIAARLHEIEDAKTLAGLLLYLRTLPERTGPG